MVLKGHGTEGRFTGRGDRQLSSIGAVTSIGISMAYAASKGGVVTFTKSLARVLARGIRVNCVLPVGARGLRECFRSVL
jgi:NAD(P)-dependent dehydrogenase (short-subunit alcohol dehydrogenase family)